MLCVAHDVLEEAALMVAQELSANGVKPQLADSIAVTAMEAVRISWSGRTIYFPRNTPKRLAQRDALIATEFNGRNWSQLARKHSLTEVRVRQIMKRSENRSKSAGGGSRNRGTRAVQKIKGV